jgi:hypothetical protein
LYFIVTGLYINNIKIGEDIMNHYVTKKELREIIKKYGSPQRYKKEAFVDMTDWIKKKRVVKRGNTEK